MTTLSPPRHPLIQRALTDARHWHQGHQIGGRPALATAARVAVALGEHVRDPDPQWIAAALLHDAPDFAPSGLHLDTVLHAHYPPEVRRIIRALRAQRHALALGCLTTDTNDRPVLLILTTDIIVTVTSLLQRAAESGDPTRFLTARPLLTQQLPLFHAFSQTSAGHVPATMTTQLRQALATLHQAATSRGQAS